MSSLEDLVALEDIRSLVIRYSYCRDMLDLDGLLALVCDEAVLHLGPRHGGDLVGRTSIREHYERAFTNSAGKPFSTLHFVTNPCIVKTADDRAQANWTFLVCIVGDPSVSPLRYLGLYDDQYQREQGVWKILKRRVDFIWPS